MSERPADDDMPRGGGGGVPPPRRTLAGIAVLASVLVLLVAAAWILWVHSGVAGEAEGIAGARARALGLVAGVCGSASLGGWIVARLGAEDPALAVSRSLAAILLRLLAPLVLLGWLATPRDAWPEAARMREAGAGGLLVVFYLSLLATDILLHIMWGPKGSRRQPTTAPRSRPPDAG